MSLDFLSGLSTTAKALAALATTAVASSGVTLAGVTIVGLPGDVAANTVAIQANTEVIRHLARTDSLILARQERTICLLELGNDLEGMSALEIDRACAPGTREDP